MIDREDHRSRRCPRLGHEVTFHYCRTQEGASICPRILDCWWETFDVASFLKDHLPPEEWRRLTSYTPKPRVVNLVELIREAQERARREGNAPAPRDDAADEDW